MSAGLREFDRKAVLCSFLILVQFYQLKKPRESSFSCLTRMVPQHRAEDQTHWLLLHRNQQGRTKYILYSSTFPPFTLLLHKNWGPSVPPPNKPCEHRWRKKAKHVLSFPWCNLGIALGATVLAEHHQGRTTLWSAHVESLYLANHALQYMAAVTSFTK